MKPETFYAEFQAPSSISYCLSDTPSDRYRTWQRLRVPPHRFWLGFADLSFGTHESSDTIVRHLQQATAPHATEWFYLLADPTAPQVCYPVDSHIEQCLAGDQAVAERLRGRTLFVIRQEERTSGVDWLSQEAVSQWLVEIEPSLPQCEGLALPLPPFCFANGCPHGRFPWHSGLMDDSYLPLLFHETYASAEARLFFWDRLFRQFRSACLKNLEHWCHERDYRFAVIYPEAAIQNPPLTLTCFGSADTVIAEPSSYPSTPSSIVHLTGSVASASPQVDVREVLLTADVLDDSPSWHAPFGIDYPISIGNRDVPDAWLRAGQLATLGLPSKQIGFLYPSESLWLDSDPAPSLEAFAAWHHWSWWLRDRGYEAMLVDPATFVDDGRVASTYHLQIGLTEFPVLVALPSVTLGTRVLEKLQSFVQEGGHLLFLKPAPYLTDGGLHQQVTLLEWLLMRRAVRVLEADELPEKEVAALSSIARELELYVRPEQDPAWGIWRRERHLDHMRWFFLWNSEGKKRELLAEVAGEKQCEDWDLRTGQKTDLRAWYANGYTYAEFSLDPYEQKILFTW